MGRQPSIRSQSPIVAEGAQSVRENLPRSRKGFLFSIDALFALVLALLLLSGIFVLLNREGRLNFGSSDLHHYNLGALTALEANGSLRRSVSADQSVFFNNFLNNATPRNICMNLTIRTSAQAIINTYQKQNCTRGSKVTIARRPLFDGQFGRIVSVESWYT